MLWSLYTNLDVFWVNNPLFGVKLLENNKFFQMYLATQVGLKIPKTLMTSSYEQLLSFCRDCGNNIAIKLISGNVFQEPAEKIKVVMTQKITSDYLASNKLAVDNFPIFAQQYVEKQLELRITIVGQRVFSCAIHSQASEFTKHDWRRYDFNHVKHEVYDLPEKIQTPLLNFMKLSGLYYGAIDMILTPNNEYIFLEVNPSGQWDWIEKLTGLPISTAIADLLSNPPS